MAARRSQPSPSQYVWEEEAFLKRAATAELRRSKFPEVFGGLGRQWLIDNLSFSCKSIQLCTVVYCIPHDGW